MSPTLIPFLVAVAAGVPAIDRAVAGIDAYAKDHPEAQRVFGCGDGRAEEATPWRAFDSEKLFYDEIGSQTAVFEVARVTIRQSAPVLVAMLASSEDFALYASYYYRADGTLARVDSRLNTFHGNVSVIRSRWYDPAGILLRRTRTVLDLHSQKAARRREFMDVPPPLYRTVSELPFANLLR